MPDICWNCSLEHLGICNVQMRGLTKLQRQDIVRMHFRCWCFVAGMMFVWDWQGVADDDCLRTDVLWAAGHGISGVRFLEGLIGENGFWMCWG